MPPLSFGHFPRERGKPDRLAAQGSPCFRRNDGCLLLELPQSLMHERTA